jgi:hypothetical protein
MGKRTAAAMLMFGLFPLFGCKARFLVLDEQWSFKQAVVDCQSRSHEGVPPCTADPIAEIRDSEAQISRAFKLDPACGGMTLVTLNASDHPEGLNSRDTWWLFVELIRSNEPNERRRFTVSHTDDPHGAGGKTGLGEPNFIVASSCKFAREGGLNE